MWLPLYQHHCRLSVCVASTASASLELSASFVTSATSAALLVVSLCVLCCISFGYQLVRPRDCQLHFWLYNRVASAISYQLGQLRLYQLHFRSSACAASSLTATLLVVQLCGSAISALLPVISLWGFISSLPMPAFVASSTLTSPTLVFDLCGFGYSYGVFSCISITLVIGCTFLWDCSCISAIFGLCGVKYVDQPHFGFQAVWLWLWLWCFQLCQLHFGYQHHLWLCYISFTLVISVGALCCISFGYQPVGFRYAFTRVRIYQLASLLMYHGCSCSFSRLDYSCLCSSISFLFGCIMAISLGGVKLISYAFGYAVVWLQLYQLYFRLSAYQPVWLQLYQLHF